MSISLKWVSILFIIITIILCTYLSFNKPQRWQFLTAGGIHFIMAMIVNRQFTSRKYNYLGLIHGFLMVLLFGVGYFVL